MLLACDPIFEHNKAGIGETTRSCANQRCTAFQKSMCKKHPVFIKTHLTGKWRQLELNRPQPRGFS